MSNFWPQVSLVVNSLELLAILWLLIQLRHAAGPHQALLIEQQRHELDAAKHSVSRIVNEHLEDRRTFLLADERIWIELREINGRLDSVSNRLDGIRCPLNDPSCPLVLKVSPGER